MPMDICPPYLPFIYGPAWIKAFFLFISTWRIFNNRNTNTTNTKQIWQHLVYKPQLVIPLLLQAMLMQQRLPSPPAKTAHMQAHYHQMKFHNFTTWQNIICIFTSFVSVPWLGSRKGIRPVKKLSGGMLAWLWCGVWDKVQICIWPSWCHCLSLSLAPINPDWFNLPGFTFLVPAHPGSPRQNPTGP